MSGAASPPSSASRVTLPPSRSSRVWRWGILGAGAISTDFCHALHLHVRNSAISIVGARDPQTAVSLSTRYGSGRTGSYAEVCSVMDYSDCSIAPTCGSYLIQPHLSYHYTVFQ